MARGKQRYCCLICGRQFVLKTNLSAFRKQLWEEYVWHKQTMEQLAKKHHRTVQWVQHQLDAAPITKHDSTSQNIIAVCDTTFFGRGYGILVVRCPRLKKNVHFHEVVSETPGEYLKARQALELQGYVIEAVVLDGKPGVYKVFDDLPVQLCQFHQIQIVKRYLTSKPKLDAGKELRAITLALSTTTEAALNPLTQYSC